MLSEAAEFLPTVEQPGNGLLDMRPSPAQANMPATRQDSSGFEFAFFLVVLMLFVWVCWPSADDQMILQSALLYAVILNSN